MSKKKSMRYGSHQYYVEKKKALIKQEAELSYRDKVKVYLSFTLEELEAMDHPLFEIIKKEMYDSEEEEYFEYDMEEYFEKGLDEGWLVENGCDNTYNWNSPISHHINFEIYHNIEEGNYLIRFRVHRYGDVRCNYSDWVYLECNSDYDFLEALMECGKWIEVEMDGKTYCISIEVTSDEIRLESYDNEEYDEIYGDDKDTILEEMINRDLISW